MKTPMKSILDPTFRYTPSHATDVRKTFERIRRERFGRLARSLRAAAPPSLPLVIALPHRQSQ